MEILSGRYYKSWRHFWKNIKILFLLKVTICLITKSEGRSVPNQSHNAKKALSEPALIFGDPNQRGSSSDLETTRSEYGFSLKDPEFAADEEFIKDLIRKRYPRSPAEEDDDEDSEEENAEDGTEDDEEINLKEDKKSNTTTTTSTTTTTKPSSSPAAPSEVPSPQGKALSDPPAVPPAPKVNGTAAPPTSFPKPTITIINGTRVMQLPQGKAPPPGFVLPPGARPQLPPGARQFPPGVRPPPGIPSHLLLNKNNAQNQPPLLAKKGELYLPEDYSNLEIPKLDVGKFIGIKQDKLAPVPVLVNLNIRSVQDIDENSYELVLNMDMRVEWVDGKLFDPLNALSSKASRQITLNPVFLNKIWQPDIYIDEIVKVRKPSLMAKPRTLLFSPGNGLVSYTFRVQTRLSCEMDFNYYPADTQRCEYHLRSYSYFDTDLNLSWLRNGVKLQDTGDPNFDLQVASIESLKIKQTFHEHKNQTYDGLSFIILARRKLSYHMVQTYLPSIFFIIITWLCFLVPARMVEARIGISMTTLLTLTAMFSSVRDSTPIVSYVKAIDVWMVFCIFFVFLTLLEFSLLVWMRSAREDAEEKKIEHQRKKQEKKRFRGKNGGDHSPSPSIRSEELKRYELIAEFTEKWAFLIFSFAFAVFNVIYWSWLLIESDYFNWNVNATYNHIED